MTLEPSLVSLAKEGTPALKSFAEKLYKAYEKYLKIVAPLKVEVMKDLVPTYKALLAALDPSAREWVKVMSPVCPKLASNMIQVVSAFTTHLRDFVREFNAVMRRPTEESLAFIEHFLQEVNKKAGTEEAYRKLFEEVRKALQELSKEINHMEIQKTIETLALETKRWILSLAQNEAKTEDLACIFDPLQTGWFSGEAVFLFSSLCLCLSLCLCFSLCL